MKKLFMFFYERIVFFLGDNDTIALYLTGCTREEVNELKVFKDKFMRLQLRTDMLSKWFINHNSDIVDAGDWALAELEYDKAWKETYRTCDIATIGEDAFIEELHKNCTERARKFGTMDISSFRDYMKNKDLKNGNV